MPSTVMMPAAPRKGLSVIDIAASMERAWFEFDRAGVLRQLGDIDRAITANAVELKMVAEEGVFARPLAVELSRAARILLSIAKDLKNLGQVVRRVDQYPPESKKKS